ncbi:MAG: SusD/RagB family nutrient-binding outer membrane lipoprotein [Flavobacteriaceae bacterium]
MKNNLIFLFLLTISGLTFTSCETSDLDLLNDPNTLTTNQAELDRLMNQIQLDFNSFVRAMGSSSGQAVRIDYGFGTTYSDTFDSGEMNGPWSTAYQSLYSNMLLAEGIATEIEENKYLGVMKILKGYTLLTMVDFIGDIPFSQATQPVEFPTPVADPGAEVYAAALGLLTDGSNLLNEPGNNLAVDLYYNNDFSKWKKAANTFKMQAYLNMGDMSSFNTIANDPSSYISSTSDDFQFYYGSNVTDPDTRNPDYSNDYTVNGGGDYRSNWLMNEMVQSNDPRLRYYFFRQTSCTPGAGCPAEPGPLPCSNTAKPNHYLGSMVYCAVENGYWGRDHLVAAGIPPDTFRRTVVGVYPAGGLFDDAVIGDSSHPFQSVSVGAGGGGAGITPIMLASWADLMKAEAALKANNTGSAAGFLQAAMQKSISKVASFISVDPTADSSVAPTSNAISNYINGMVSSFNSGSADVKWTILAKQSLIGHYTNGIGAYNMYRRTGYPHDLQFAVDPNPGPFVRSFFYPNNESTTNDNIVQKDGLNTQVFWDTNPPSPGFPVAN